MTLLLKASQAWLLLSIALLRMRFLTMRAMHLRPMYSTFMLDEHLAFSCCSQLYVSHWHTAFALRQPCTLLSCLN